MCTFKKALGGIAMGFTLLVLIGAMVFVGPKLFGFNTYIVESGSMEPTIHTGSVAYINTHATNAAPGDVITFRISADNPEKLVTHRIVREEAGAFITKGDANETEDANPVNKEQIVGTYSYSIPKVGFIMAKKDRVLKALAFWVVGLNALSVLADVALNDECENGKDEKSDAELMKNK